MRRHDSLSILKQYPSGAALFEYIEIFYNQRWRHLSIGYRTPAQARKDMTIAQTA